MGILQKPTILKKISDIESSLGENVKHLKDWVNIKTQFGAKGDYDGATGTDDSASFQAAFDYANTNGVGLYIPKGNYLINTSIILRENGAYLVEGCNVNVNAYISKNNCKITCNATDLFVGETSNALTGMQIQMSYLHFYKPNGTSSNCLFKDIKLTSSRFHHNSALGFGSIVKGKLETVTKFYDNFIEAIRNGFLTVSTYDDGANLVDSEIYNNYLNGEAGSNITMFQLTYPAYSIIHDNFIDFCKYVFVGYNTSGIYYDIIRNIRIYNNTFDYCFRFLPSNHFMRYCVLENNKFSKFSATYKSSFPNSDTDMNGEWGVFVTPLFKYVSIVNSLIENCDNYLKCSSSSSCSVKIRNTVYATNPTVKCYYEVANTADLNDTYIEELENVQYATFPTSPSGKYIFYNNQHVVYNNKVLRFYAGTFYDMDGNVVSS